MLLTKYNSTPYQVLLPLKFLSLLPCVQFLCPVQPRAWACFCMCWVFLSRLPAGLCLYLILRFSSLHYPTKGKGLEEGAIPPTPQLLHDVPHVSFCISSHHCMVIFGEFSFFSSGFPISFVFDFWFFFYQSMNWNSLNQVQHKTAFYQVWCLLL